MTSFGQSVLYYIAVFVYPIYKSINAYEIQNKSETLKYLNYWIIFGVFYCFKPIFDYIFSFVILPTLMKSLFFLYIYCPLTDGYKVVYELGVRRVLRLYEQKIDKYIRMAEEELTEKSINLRKTIA